MNTTYHILQGFRCTIGKHFLLFYGNSPNSLQFPIGSGENSVSPLKYRPNFAKKNTRQTISFSYVKIDSPSQLIFVDNINSYAVAFENQPAQVDNGH